MYAFVTHTGGGRNPVTGRFLRHFNQIAHTELEHESMLLIFTTIVDNSLTKFTPEIKELTGSVVQATLDV